MPAQKGAEILLLHLGKRRHSLLLFHLVQHTYAARNHRVLRADYVLKRFLASTMPQLQTLPLLLQPSELPVVPGAALQLNALEARKIPSNVLEGMALETFLRQYNAHLNDGSFLPETDE